MSRLKKHSHTFPQPQELTIGPKKAFKNSKTRSKEVRIEGRIENQSCLVFEPYLNPKCGNFWAQKSKIV